MNYKSHSGDYEVQDGRAAFDEDLLGGGDYRVPRPLRALNGKRGAWNFYFFDRAWITN